MKMFCAGEWVDRSETIHVTNPYDESVIDTVPKAAVSDVDGALATLVQGAAAMRCDVRVRSQPASCGGRLQS